nr:unnamed protein product [Meloidogyne enterolobii]
MKQQIGDKVDRTNIILEGIERALQIQNRELQGIRQELTHQGAAIRRNSRDLRVIHQELINQRQRFGRVFSYSAAPQPGQQVQPKQLVVNQNNSTNTQNFTSTQQIQRSNTGSFHHYGSRGSVVKSSQN